MNKRYEDWGRLASFGQQGLLDSADLYVPRQDSQSTLGRAPDFEDAYTVSWGRLTHEEVERLIRREADSDLLDEYRALISKWFASHELVSVTLYYTDPYHGC